MLSVGMTIKLIQDSNEWSIGWKEKHQLATDSIVYKPRSEVIIPQIMSKWEYVIQVNIVRQSLRNLWEGLILLS